MSHPHPDDNFAATLRERDRTHRRRSRSRVEVVDAVHLVVDDVPYVNFSSNNYLALTHHPAVLEAARNALSFGAGAGAAGLITGYTTQHADAEQSIATWKGTEAAVILPSGYQANVAAVQTLAAAEGYTGGVRFLLDKLAHASLIDAIRSTDAEMRVFPHNGIEKLRRLLGAAPADQLQIVVTESIFSMDGDAADLASLAALKSEHPFVLLLDEAHGSGVYGPAGRGYAAEVGLQEIVDVTVVTLSKALGCVGGAVCGSRIFCEALLNFGRAYIYSTSVPPFVAATARAAIDVMRDEPQRQARVRALARRVRLAIHGNTILRPGALQDSPIVPILLGEESRALAAAESLRAAGFWVTAVRPPTVPHGSSRLRISLSSAHADDDVDRLTDLLRTVVLQR